MVILGAHPRVVEDPHVDQGPDVPLAEEVLGLALADVELVDLQVLRPAGERPPVDPDDPLLAVQELGEGPPQVAGDPGDRDCRLLRGHPSSPYQNTLFRSRSPWFSIDCTAAFTCFTFRSSSASSSSALPVKRIGSPK